MGAGLPGVRRRHARASAPTVDLYEDFQCPACKQFEAPLGSTIQGLAPQGKIKLVYHVMNFLDDNLRNDNSTRAANGAFCAADDGKFQEFHDAVFPNQPWPRARASPTPSSAFAEHGRHHRRRPDDLEELRRRRHLHRLRQLGQGGRLQGRRQGTPTVRINGKDVDIATIASPGAAHQGRRERHQVTLSRHIPSPTVGVCHLGPLPVRMYALCILIGIVVAVWLTGRRLVPRGGRAGQALDVAAWAVLFGIVGGRLYHVITTPGPLLGRGRQPGRRPEDLGGRPRHLGRHLARRARRLDRLPAGRHQLPDLRRRGGARRRVRPGHRPVRQLVQQRALRRPDDPAVGPARSTSGTHGAGRAVLDAAGNPVVLGHLPPDVPLRGGLPRGARHAAARRRQAALARARAS